MRAALGGGRRSVPDYEIALMWMDALVGCSTGASLCPQLNDVLEARTYLVAGAPSLGDLAAFAAVSPAVAALPEQGHPPLISLLRWYDHVHHLAVGRGSSAAAFPPVALKKAPFRPPPPLAANKPSRVGCPRPPLHSPRLR